MFKGIQDIMRDKSAKTDIDSSLIRIQSSRLILDTEKRQELLDKLPQLLCLSSDNFDKLVMRFIEHFAEFVQDLPETRNGYYASRGGIFDHAINRATIALSLIRAYFLPDGDDSAPLTQPQTLWAYVVFTAGMLMGIGKVAADLKIELYDAEGKFLKIWSPFDGRMITMASYYKYDYDEPYPDFFRTKLSVLLARQLLPIEGFRWLASDKNLFHIWLSLLDDDERGSHTLGPMLWLADSLSIQEYFEWMMQQDNDPKSFLERGKFGPIGGAFAHMQDRDSTNRNSQSQSGIEFLNWLREGITRGQIKIGGDNPVHYIPEGVVLNPGIFEVFVRENPIYKRWQAVQTAFCGLGIHRQTGHGNDIFQKYIKTDGRNAIEGLLISNPELILSKEILKNQKPEQAIRLPATKNDQPQFISTTGKLVSTPPSTIAPHILFNPNSNGN